MSIGLLEMMLKAEGDETGPKWVSDTEKLADYYQTLNQKNEFKEGDLVQWKPGLRNRNTDAVGVVVSVLPEAVWAQTDKASINSFYEPLDIAVGHIAPDGDFSVFHYDSRRLQHFKG